MSKNHIDELAAAEVFLQVVKAQGFTPAAKVLGRNASSLSRTLADLEHHLGAQLLTRTTRRIHLTEAGALYATHAEALVTAQRAARDAIAELMGGVPRGRLRVSMPVSVGERLLAPALPAFRRAHPELKLEVDLSDRNVALVQGGFDLAVRVGRPADSSLRAQLLGRVPVRLVASPTYLAARRAPKTPADIADHDCLTLGAAAGPVEWTFHRRRSPTVAERVTIDGVVHTTSAPLAARLAVAGMGLLRSNEWVIRDELATGSLVEVMPSWSCDDPAEGGVPVHVMFAQGQDAIPPLKSRVFVALLKDVMAREVPKTARDPAAQALRDGLMQSIGVTRDGAGAAGTDVGRVPPTPPRDRRPASGS